MISIFRLARSGSLLAATLLLTACQLLPFYDDRDGDHDQRQEPTQPGGGSATGVGGSPVERAMQLLQDGEESAAEALLVEVLAARPEDTVARLLQAQIQRPPEELLGEEFTEIEVRPGDSLSAIAARHIGNELLFYALARLNEIERPRLLRPGQLLKVPVMRTPEDGMETATDSKTPESADAPAEASPVATTVEELLSRGRLAQAQGLLLSTARADRLDETTTLQLVGVSAELARTACRNDDPDRARAVLDRARPWIGARAEAGEFAAASAHVSARLAMIEARQSIAAGDYAAAFDGLDKVRNIDESIAREHGPELAGLESALVEHYHGRALSAWRDQEVDSAVSFWQKVIDVDPGFEPAQVYLERALRVKRELESLEER